MTNLIKSVRKEVISKLEDKGTLLKLISSKGDEETGKFMLYC